MPTPIPCPTGESSTELGCIPNDPGGFVTKAYDIGLGLIGGVAILFMIYGGYLIMTSKGSTEQLARGKSYIMYAILGLLLAVFGFVFVQFIAGDLLNLPGFDPNP